MASVRDIVIADPFDVLRITVEADDAAIKRRYLSLVRAAPPDREPERFQIYRRAYEAIQDVRARAELRMLHSTDSALSTLKRFCLQTETAACG